MDITLYKKDRINRKKPEMSRILGNSATLKQLSYDTVIQCVRHEDVKGILQEGRASIETMPGGKAMSDKKDMADDDADLDWDFDNEEKQEEEASLEAAKAKVYESIGRITHVFEDVCFNLNPDEQMIFGILEGQRTIESYDEYLFHIFNYARGVYQKICQTKDLPASLSALALTEGRRTDIDITVLNADPHGFGPPIKLEKDGRAVVYKDRFGFADKLVTDLFAKINLIMGSRRMPAYDQYAFSDHGLLSEFIEGEHRPGIPSGNFSGDAKQFQALQWVAKEIGLTDLHFENVVFSKTGGMNLEEMGTEEIVPVDLEAFDTGMETALYPRSVHVAARTASLGEALPAEALPEAALPAEKAMQESDISKILDSFKEDSEEEEVVLGSSAETGESISKIFESPAKSAQKRTNVGNPDMIDPEALFGNQNLKAVREAVEETKIGLFATKKRFVPVSTSSYNDSWSIPAARRSMVTADKVAADTVATDMIEKTEKAFQKRSFDIKKDALKATMKHLVTIDNAIPMFVRVREEIQQFDVIKKDWVTVAICIDQLSRPSLSSSSSSSSLSGASPEPSGT